MWLINNPTGRATHSCCSPVGNPPTSWSRDHLHIKGAEVPFEDEKFSYVVLSRSKPQSIDARVLAPPKITKSAVAAKLCTDGGVVTDIAARRDPDAYRRRKSWRWGDS